MAAAMVSFVMCLVMYFSLVILSQRAVVSGDVIMRVSFSAASADRLSLNPVILVREIPDSGLAVAISPPGRDNGDKMNSKLALTAIYPDTPPMSVRQRT